MIVIRGFRPSFLALCAISSKDASHQWSSFAIRQAKYTSINYSTRRRTENRPVGDRAAIPDDYSHTSDPSSARLHIRPYSFDGKRVESVAKSIDRRNESNIRHTYTPAASVFILVQVFFTEAFKDVGSSSAPPPWPPLPPRDPSGNRPELPKPPPGRTPGRLQLPGALKIVLNKLTHASLFVVFHLFGPRNCLDDYDRHTSKYKVARRYIPRGYRPLHSSGSTPASRAFHRAYRS